MISWLPRAAGDRLVRPGSVCTSVLPWKFSRAAGDSTIAPTTATAAGCVRRCGEVDPELPACRCRAGEPAHHGDGQGDFRPRRTKCHRQAAICTRCHRGLAEYACQFGVRGEADRGVPGQCGFTLGEARFAAGGSAPAGGYRNSTDTAENASTLPAYTLHLLLGVRVHADRAVHQPLGRRWVLVTPYM